MLDRNHINFARQILRVCRLDERVSSLSNLPTFIVKKNIYNNFYFQPLSHLPDMLEVVVHILRTFHEQGYDEGKTSHCMEPVLKSLQQDMQSSTNYMERYYYQRKIFFYQKILHALTEISDQYISQAKEKCISPSLFCQENESALFLSFISFVYFGLWLSPHQLFFPESSLCSGSWDLWKEIDYFRFLEEFAPDLRTDFSPEIYQDSIWRVSLDPFSLIKAMLIRMGERGNPSIPYSIVDRTMREFLRFLGLNEYRRVDTELEFLKNYEAQQEEYFRKVFKKTC